jgi:hypothetical protein
LLVWTPAIPPMMKAVQPQQRGGLLAVQHPEVQGSD